MSSAEHETAAEAKVGSVVAETPRDAHTANTGLHVQPKSGKRAGAQEPHAAERRLSGIERTVGLFRAAVPVLQKVLPLLDGNVALAAANLIAPRLQAPPVDLQPLEATVSKMRSEIAELRTKLTTHDSALKRIEQQADAIQESLERSAASQKEVTENLERVQRRVTTLTVVSLLLLAVLITANGVLLVRMTGLLH